ncbi:MAG: FeoA family protein [Sphingomonadales bacterium]
MLLSKMKPGDKGLISQIYDIHPTSPQLFPDLCSRLIEIGFDEGARIEVLHESPISKNPMAIEVNGRIIAIRRIEAEAIEVKTSSDPQ